MGVMKELKGTVKYPKKGQAREYQPSLLQTFHPTVQEKEVLKAREADIETLLVAVETWIEKGNSFTLGQRMDTDSFYALIREKGTHWEQARGLTAWHGNLIQALNGLVFALETRYEDFPEIDIQTSMYKDEW